MIGAFFDVDGTLFKAHMWRGLVDYGARHGRANHVRLYFAAHLPLLYLHKLHLIGEEAFRKPWVMNLGWILRGWTVAEGEAALHWVAQEYIRPTGREDMLACLREHVSAGHTVVLVSAMLSPTLRVLGEVLGATGVVGTDVEIKDGHFSGRVIPPACMGIYKERQTRRFLQARGLAVDLASSFAYADSISDRALLEMVGHPIAVYPDPALAALARERNWEIRPSA